MAPRLTMKLPWLLIVGGVGSRQPPVLLSSHNSSLPAGTQIGGGLSRQPGSSSSSGPGSITAPERMCAPMVDDFSLTHTGSSGLRCLSEMAKDSPAGPARTVTPSYVMQQLSLMIGHCQYPPTLPDTTTGQ